jgi:alkanesulfonate monooxygenase SsuD/methylene tetrahydromethanopterin reductase-like flavin-dependent oxidoreductase (luciferase family)
VRIGVSPWGSSRDGVLRVASAAADAGVDTLWLGDGLLVVPDFPPWSGGSESFTELSWLAGRFPSLGIGITAAVLPLRDIMWVAKQSSTLDHLTQGRFYLAVTPGIWEREYVYRKRSFLRRGELFEEGIHALRAAFDGAAFSGDSITLPVEGRLSPIPLTPGGPPLWLAGERATMERALRLGLPFQARAKTPELLAPLAKEWFDRGGGELNVRVAIEVADDIDESGLETESVASVNAIIGPPKYLIENLLAFADLNVADVSLMPGRNDHASLHTVEALGSEILPALGR